MSGNVEYTRKFSICRNIAADATCTFRDCLYSHTLIDTARVVALVGDVAALPPSSAGSSDEKVYFLIEYTKYSTISDDADPDETKWRMKLVGGGRATLCSAGLGTDPSAGSVSVQPVYPLKGIAREGIVALATLEKRVFGRTYPPDPDRRTLCKQFSNECCRLGPSCRYSHTMFDAQRVDTLLDEAVQERGYKDYRPLIEIEYLRQSSRPEPMWRVTLRCIVGGYQQKASPQPVVATGADLNSAFRLLERQFAASSGKPQGPTPQADFSSHRRSSTANARPSRGGHRRRPSAPSNATPPRPSFPVPPPAASTAQPSFPESPAMNNPPPSYHDTMRGNFAPSNSHDSQKRRL